ncbi:serine/threonine-protein kinase ULK1a isoform X1 [Solea solea]|uniref:serine/threonine-protein kinase ULK1a isoform X1 n=1 Tax=Solea solea TaxID=90069 RepID=UPI00272D8594|nr:serine/threonine-protein kinase ULK1a isoform X1 [Solea solea]XP_058492700.1 serine/threonine-protein kinase ULK1a isoform X1 [Solea solea]
METVGKFEFSRKDLIGHGAFAVVFKGRHKERRNCEVAVKCINKKNLAKSHVLLGKEIKILKELKHENIVSLLDYQEMGGCVYLVMEYCNGGDLAEYLHSKGTLSEDTIRVFLQQIAQAMKVLRSKGILHRDLKPQNILLCHPEGRRSTSVNTYIKIADFGFARHLQTDTMAATLCGSPMYMAPEVIMSQTYDAKADLWSIGTIVYQCLTGKAPFHASTPQELRLFYESNRTLLPKVPKETSGHLRHLLMGLLQRNPQERMSFDEFFHHPFLETCSSTKKCSPVPMFSYPSSGSGSSSSSSSTSHQVSPQHSDAEIQQLRPKELYSPTQNTAGFLEKDTANQECRKTSSYTEDYVMVPAKFPNECTCDVDVVSPIESCLIYSGSPPVAERDPRPMEKTLLPSPPPHSPSKPVRDLHSKPAGFGGRSVPIPVPTQIQNYQRMEENLQPVGSHGSPRITLCCAGTRREDSPRCGGYKEAGSGFNSPSSAAGGALLQPCSPRVGTTPTISEQILPLSTRTGLNSSHSIQNSVTSEQVYSRMPKQMMTVPDLQSFDPSAAPHTNLSSKSADKRGPFKRSRALSTGMLSEMLLRAAFGAEDGSDESLHSEKGMDITAPPTGYNRGFQYSNSPPPAVFISGCPSEGNTPPDSMLKRRSSDSPNYSAWLHRGRRRCSETEVMDASPRCLIIHPPELAEDTLMEEAHTDTLNDLRFTWGFVHCIMELASSKDQGLDAIISPDVSFLEQSLVTDQISLLSKEWSYAEQLVLYMKAEEFLSSALHTAKENIKHGELVPSATVKQVIRKLNELYKSCVTYCRSLNNRLQTFLLDKQKLMDHFTGLTAEKLIYSHTVHMVQAAALDEMFHYGTASIQRYQRALLLLEGLSRMMTEQKDIDSVHKCKECIERRLSSLQTEQYP